MFERYLLVKGVNHVNVPRGEHHSIRVAEKVIQDLNNMMICMLSDSNVPNIYWDFVIEHVVLVNSMITPSISNKTETIFELQYCKLAPPAETGRVWRNCPCQEHVHDAVLPPTDTGTSTPPTLSRYWASHCLHLLCPAVTPASCTLSMDRL